MKRIIVIVFLLSAKLFVFGDYIVVTKPGQSVYDNPYDLIVVDTQDDLNVFGIRTGAYPGRFPALVDSDAGLWVYIDGTLNEAESAMNELRQINKTDEQKEEEAAFFELCRSIEGDAGEESTTNKLTISEITSMIETIETTNVMGAVKYSIKMLSIDATLKRYDTLWWDHASN